ncbi:SprT family zinc-dependent metalloprotease [uncultured Sunxiuqinia sp.]|uniref:M48 family metallopeptidase n=1 Tax=uncultured Sunxiuqinia sp. TaxID=1573825 RepID=UPI002627FF38|nr:SprT family zinc-dependent metalloprotease [uncultured Sunxiuqinia sp.]
MKAEKVIDVEPVGQVTLVRNERSRYFRLRVKPNGLAHVSMPVLASESKAIDFVKSKTAWIQEQQQKLKTGLTVFRQDSSFRTKFHQLRVVKVRQSKVSNSIGNGIIQINIPEHINHEHPPIQQFIRRTLVEVMRYEAKVYLPARLQELADKHQFQFEKVFVKHVKSRWGSCSYTNNINLNVHLMRLPDHLTDYVLLHELAHTREKNHSARFWNLLESVCPNSKQLDRELKNYQVDIF